MTKTIEIMSFKTAESIRSPNPFTGVIMTTQQQQYIQSLSFTIRKVYFHYIKDHSEQTYGKHWEYRLVPDGMDTEKWQNNLFFEGQERFGATCEIEVHQPTSRKVTHTECTASHCSNGFVSWNGNWAECSTCQDNRMIQEHRLPRNRIPGFRNPY